MVESEIVSVVCSEDVCKSLVVDAPAIISGIARDGGVVDRRGAIVCDAAPTIEYRISGIARDGGVGDRRGAFISDAAAIFTRIVLVAGNVGVGDCQRPVVYNSAARVARDDATGERQISFVENPCGVFETGRGATAPLIVMPEIVTGELPAVTLNTTEPNSPWTVRRPAPGPAIVTGPFPEFTTSPPGFPPVIPATSSVSVIVCGVAKTVGSNVTTPPDRPAKAIASRRLVRPSADTSSAVVLTTVETKWGVAWNSTAPISTVPLKMRGAPV